MFNIPGDPVRIVVRAMFDGVQWTAPNKFRRTLGMVDVITFDRPTIGQEITGRLADEWGKDSYASRMKAEAEDFGDVAYLVIGERA